MSKKIWTANEMGRKGAAGRVASTTPAERSAMGRKAWEGLTDEEYAAACAKLSAIRTAEWAKLTPAERRAKMARVWKAKKKLAALKRDEDEQ